MRLVIIRGLSGSGKSVALNALEDNGFYCIDNIPVSLLQPFIKEIQQRRNHGYKQIGACLDGRNLTDIAWHIDALRRDVSNSEVVFLQATDETLLSRFSETQRRHPLTRNNVSLKEAVLQERALLSPVINMADLIIDTSTTTVHDLRELVRDRIVKQQDTPLSILIESFGYKHGLPADADFVFDVRCLPNPYWEPSLRPLNGKDKPVRDFLNGEPQVQKMIENIGDFLQNWIPWYRRFQRSYLTIAIGCTGGQHRSVYIAETLATRLSKENIPVQTRHHL